MLVLCVYERLTWNKIRNEKVQDSIMLWVQDSRDLITLFHERVRQLGHREIELKFYLPAHGRPTWRPLH